MPGVRPSAHIRFLHRVQELRSEAQPTEADNRPYIKLTPLMELLAHTMDRRRGAKSVGQAYQRICSELGGEIEVVTRARLEDLKQVGGEDLASAVTKVRAGEVEIVAGFDGRYGTVNPVR